MLDYDINKRSLLLAVGGRDISYSNAIRSMLGKYFGRIAFTKTVPKSLVELKVQMVQHRCTHVATTDFALLKKLDYSVEGNPSDNYGTVVSFPTLDNSAARLVFLPSFDWLFKVPHGFFIIERYIKKLSVGFLKKDSFSWQFVTPQNLQDIVTEMNSSFLAAVDIETSKDDLRITSVSYTYGYKDHLGRVRTKTFVIKCSPEEYPFCITAMRVLNKTKCPKVMQNGRYDASYFLRFDAPLYNYLYDTYHMQHCLYPELDRDLANISSFYLDDFHFWKDESGRNLYEYNGKDTHNTFWTWLAQVMHANEAGQIYAIKNYLIEFPLVFPCISCGLDGFEVDEDIRQQLRQKEVERRDSALARLNFLIGETDFNPGSSQQVKQLMAALGRKTITGTSEKELRDWAHEHPLYDRIVKLIWDYRGAVKAISTYFDVELLDGRLLYSLDPGGTDSGRMASKASNFWCGTQIQNIPPYAKKMVIAPDGWEYGAVDKAQAESYCTAHLSGDKGLLDAVYNSPDFHCHNASMFFGIPFEQLYDVKTKKKLNVELRNLAKRVNHGANYNMGPFVLLTTMGLENVLVAQRLLKLPQEWAPIKVTEYLMQCFDKAYPDIRGRWYQEIIQEVQTTGKLTLESVGWTRRTFLRPTKSKPELNTAVSHKPQSLSVNLVNKAFFRIWKELQLGKYNGKFRLKAQIHDEIVHMARKEINEQVTKEVAELMVIPTEVNGRIMTIPSTWETGKCWADLKG